MNWNEIQMKRLNDTEVGKFILCESKEHGATRLFIHQFNGMMSALTKNGWWDTYTISKESCKKGFYICKIEEFRLDRNGFLNLYVRPGKFVGEHVDENLSGWEYLFFTKKFSSEYSESIRRPRFNTGYLELVFQDRFESSGYKRMPDFILAEFMLGNISIEEISSCLEKKNSFEEISEDLVMTNKYDKLFPLTKKKMPKQCYVNDVLSFLERKYEEYESLNLGDEIDILTRVESVLAYWEDKKQERKRLEKEVRKQKRLSKKNK